MARQSSRGSSSKGSSGGSSGGSPGGGSGTARRRQQKSPRTIDAEAKSIEDRMPAAQSQAADEAADEAIDAAMAPESGNKPRESAGKAAEAVSGTVAGDAAEASSEANDAVPDASPSSGEALSEAASASLAGETATADEIAPSEGGAGGKAQDTLPGAADPAAKADVDDAARRPWSEEGGAPTDDGGQREPEEGEPGSAPTIAPVPKAERTSRGRSVLAMLFSGLLGGGVVMAGNAAMNSGALSGLPVIGPYLSAAPADAVPDAQTGALVEQVTGLSARLDAIAGQVGELEARGGETGEAAADAGAGLQALEARIASLEAQIGEATAQAGGGADGDELAALRSAVEAAQQRADEALAAAANGGGGGDPAALQTAVQSAVQSSLQAAMGTSLAPLEERLAAMEAVGAGAAETAVDPAAIEALESANEANARQILELREELASAGSQSAALNETVSAMDNRIAGIEQQVNDQVLPALREIDSAAEAAVRGQAVARSVSARALAGVLENGGIFASELAAAEALLGPVPAVEALKPIARQGIASPAGMQNAFDEAAGRVLALANRPDENEGVVSRLLGSARSLVTVRPAGPVEGDTPAAILSRMEAALGAGDYQTMLAERDALPPEAQEASAELAGLAGQRIEAQRLIGEIIEALSSAGGQEG